MVGGLVPFCRFVMLSTVIYASACQLVLVLSVYNYMEKKNALVNITMIFMYIGYGQANVF